MCSVIVMNLVSAAVGRCRTVVRCRTWKQKAGLIGPAAWKTLPPRFSKPYVVRGGKITAGVGQFSRDGSATSAANVLGLCSFGVSLPATYLQFWRSDFSLASMRCSGVNCELTFSSCDKKPTLDQCAWGGWGCNICNGGKPGPH
jgi:hypothetical protein